MRVSDNMLKNAFLTNLSDTKERLLKVQKQITTQSKINKPSDNPIGSSKVTRLAAKIDTSELYVKNINEGKAIVENTVAAMSGVQSEIGKTILALTSVQNATQTPVLDTYANQMDQVLNSILDFANLQYQGAYMFSGVDQSEQPFKLAGGKVDVNLVKDGVTNLGGERKLAISSSTKQKVNISGEELFQSVIYQTGNIIKESDSTNALKIYGADGIEHTLNVTFDHQAGNTFNFAYDIDGGAPTTVNNLVFDVNGALSAMDGKTPFGIHIQDAAKKIDFVYNPSRVTQSDVASSLSESRNLDSDIFNVIIAIKEKLTAKERPTAKQIEMVDKFNKHLIQQMSNAGNLVVRLEDMEVLTNTQKVEMLTLMSKEKDVDMAEAIIEMQSEQNNLNTIYKTSSQILPQSLLDYL